MTAKNISQSKILVLAVILVIVWCCGESEASQNDLKDQDSHLYAPKANKAGSSKENGFKFSGISSHENEDTTGSEEHHSATIQFRENQQLSRRGSESQPPLFFTQKQKSDNRIHYPNITTNPNNLLPLTQEETATLHSVISTPTPKPAESEEHNFFDVGKKKIPRGNGTELVRTMELTLDIVRNSFWGEQNVIFSPLSVCNILALLMLGAGGKTYDEIAKVLRVRDVHEYGGIDVEKDTKFHESFQKLREYLDQRSGKDMSLEIANEIFTDKSFSLKPFYVKQAEQFYETPVRSFNFGSEGKLFRDQVNKWVQQKTNGKIKTIIDEPPSPETTLAFINAVYFKGNWEVPFVERITRTKPFYVKENETMNVQMMTNVITIPYYEHEDYQMVAIPYKGNTTGFFAILPKASNGIEGLKSLEHRLSTLSPDDLLQRVNEMRPQKVALKIPKMKIATDGHMREILTNMGIPSMFEPYSANFTKISPLDGLFVSAVHHRAMVDVNEKGTEAAAVTIGTGDRTIDELPVPFVANKPFMFFIYNVKAKAVLFWGRVTRPEWT